MKLLTYNDMSITVLRSTPDPSHLVSLACNITQKQDPFEDLLKGLKSKVKTCALANHSSVFEHAGITILITNVSRSFMAQLTRHRHASYTCSSQHYQDYRDYPMVVHPDINFQLQTILEAELGVYIGLIDDEHVPPQEARQVLPNATACTILMTVNARSLINLLNLRMCKRNTDEMHMFAFKLYENCITWWPDLFKYIGPDCMMTNCRQGKLSCGDPYDKIGN
jgi:thymidylate synthase (FAD)